MSTPAPIRTALLGYGLAGSVFHAPAIAANPRFHLDAIATSDPARRARALRLYPGVRLFATPQDLLADPGRVELVVIATPPATHAPLGHAALDAGLAVVVDKPFATSSAEGEALREHAAQLGAVLTCYHNRRWDGEFLTLKKLLADGALGDVRRFESRLERWQQHAVKAWKTAATPEAGGGVLFDLGTHLIDQALQLFGPVSSVHGELDIRRPGGVADDDAFVALQHAGGVRSHLWMNLNAAQQGARLLVQGSRGAYSKATADVQEEQLKSGILPGTEAYGVEPQQRWGRLGIGEESLPVPTERGDFPAFYRLLAGAIRDGGQVPVDPADAVAGLRILEEVRAQAALAIHG